MTGFRITNYSVFSAKLIAGILLVPLGLYVCAIAGLDIYDEVQQQAFKERKIRIALVALAGLVGLLVSAAFTFHLKLTPIWIHVGEVCTVQTVFAQRSFEWQDVSEAFFFEHHSKVRGITFAIDWMLRLSFSDVVYLDLKVTTEQRSAIEELLKMLGHADAISS